MKNSEKAIAVLAIIVGSAMWGVLFYQGGLPRRSLAAAGSVAGGLFAVSLVFLDSDWFFEHPQARPLVEKFGRSGARVFYALLGSGLIALGIVLIVSRA